MRVMYHHLFLMWFVSGRHRSEENEKKDVPVAVN